MQFSEWENKEKRNGGYYECKVSLFSNHDPVMVIRFWETGPFIFRGYYEGKVDHTVGTHALCCHIRLPIEKMKRKAKELAVEIMMTHFLDGLDGHLKEIAMNVE